MNTTNSKPLASFRHSKRKTIAALEGLKSIMEVTTVRKLEYWLVLPSVGDSDARCILIEKQKLSIISAGYYVVTIKRVLSHYLPRITKLHFTGQLADEINAKIAAL